MQGIDDGLKQGFCFRDLSTFSMRKKTDSPLMQSQTDKNFDKKIAVCLRVRYYSDMSEVNNYAK